MRTRPDSSHPLRAGRCFVSFLLCLCCGCDSESRLSKARELGPPLVDFTQEKLASTKTTVICTLDTPVENPCTIVWCSTFALAWKKLGDAAGAPLELAGAPPAAARLRATPVSEDDLPVGSYLLLARLPGESISDEDVGRIPKALRSRLLAIPEDAAFAYAHVHAAIPFEREYFAEGTLSFLDSSGSFTDVEAFGVDGSRHDERSEELRKQVDVLYCEGSGEDCEFVIDLCRTSTPSQILVAKVRRGKNLAETVARVEQLSRQEAILRQGETLLVPRISFLLDHRFEDLEGPERIIRGGKLNAMPIVLAEQSVRFELNRRGAKVKSRALMAAGTEAGPEHRRFLCDRPFLVIMKKRGAARPFLAVWVDNAEVLHGRAVLAH